MVNTLEKEGGSAFPSVLQFGDTGACANSRAEFRGGMSLRDYFAASAIQGQLPNQSDNRTQAQNIAERAYLLADAMLAARNKQR